MQISSTGSHSHSTFYGPSIRENQASSAQQSSAHKLTPDEEKQVQELKKRDRQVRVHEQAHKAAAGQYAQGGPTYEYVTGPDGRQYAVGGEVQIDTSEVQGDPEATIRKAQIIKRAALAPQEPSSQDRQVAAAASRMEAEARRELAQEQAQEGRIYNQRGSTLPTSSSVDMFV